MRRSPEELLEAYVDANHELVNALAAIKSYALMCMESGITMSPKYVYDTADGKLELARATVR